MIGHEERVHIVLMAIQCLVKTGKTEFYLIGSCNQKFRRNHDVLVSVSTLNGLALSPFACNDIGCSAKVS